VLILSIALGGALGAVLRYGVVTLSAQWFGKSFPYGTLTVNILGSFLIGVLFIWFQSRGPHLEILRAALIVGVLGGFTTFSAFSLESFNLFMAGHAVRAGMNILFNVLLCVGAAAGGIRLSKHLFT